MVRVLIAGVLALLISILIAPRLISYLRNRGYGQHIREEGPQHHFVKAGELLGDTPEHPVFKIFWPQANPDSFDAPPSLLALRTSKQR